MQAIQPLKILFIEDPTHDANLAERTLRQAGLHFSSQTVQAEEAFMRQLEDFQPDLIIADYTLPQFDSLRALQFSLAQDSTRPFIIFTDSNNVETAVACMKAGVTDYILKQHSANLPRAVQKAIARQQLHMANQPADRAPAKPETHYKNLFANNHAVMLLINPSTGAIVDANPAACAYYGWTHEQLCRMNVDEINTLGRKDVFAEMQRARSEDRNYFLFKHRRADGSVRDVEVYSGPIAIRGEALLYSIVHDITERVQAEEQIRGNESRLQSLLRIVQHDADTIQDLLDYALNEAVKLMDSQIGYLFLYNEQQRELSLNTWVGTAMDEGIISDFPTVYQLDETGIWGDAVRQRKPVIVNDFQAAHPSRKGYPEGHVALHNYMGVPVFSGDQIVAVVGMGNKESDYIQTDVWQLTLLIDSAWKLVEHKAAQDALRASEARYREFLNATADMAFIKDDALRYVVVNPAYQEFLDKPLAEIIGATDNDLMPEEMAHVCQRTDRQALETQRVVINLEHVRGRTYETRKFPVTLGETAGVGGFIRDVTDQSTAEQTLRRQSTALHAAANAIVITDRAGLIDWANPAFTALTGYSLEESQGQTPGELLQSGVQDQAFYQELWDTILAGQVWRGELTNRRKDGSLYSEEQTITPVTDDDGTITHFIAIKQDVTARNQTRNALQASEEKYRQIVETAQEGIWMLDAENNTVFVNERMAKMLGYTVEDMLGQPLFAFMDDAAKTTAETQVERRRQGVREQHEFVFQRKDGTPLWTIVSTNPLFDSQGKYRGAQGMVTDISELKQAQTAERKQRQLAEALAQTARALISAVDLDAVMKTILENIDPVVPHDAANIMVIEDGQSHVAYWRGYGPEQIQWLQDFRVSIAQTPNLRRMFDTGLPFLVSHTEQYPDWIREPLTKWVKSYVAAPIRSQGKVIGFLNVDSGAPGYFTEEHAQRLQVFADQASLAIEHAQLYEQIQRHAEELEQRVIERTAELNHAKERIEAILNSSNDVIILCREDGTIEQTNSAFAETFGLDADAALDKRLTELVIPEHTPLLDRTFRSVMRTRQSQRLEVIAQYKDSPSFDADIIFSPVVVPGHELFGVVCSIRDITQHKRMEARLRQMLEHEMELGELKSRYMAMAAHDLRNPLAVIRSAVDMLQRYRDRLSDTRIQHKYAAIQANIQIMVDMLDDVLTLGKAESGKLQFTPKPIDVVGFSKQIASEISQATGTTSRIDFSYQGDCGTLAMDETLLRHILGNLLSNALKYSPDDSEVTFTVTCQPDEVVFHVHDQGIGIPQGDQKNLFEAFHRASNTGQVPGTGLGLSIVKQSVELHGGSIMFRSEEGIGTTFSVTLPIIKVGESK